ncbi:MAG: hypothetical protein KDA63_01970 [Planctomycetales bacterium]|nr:hypothetical protein [Planctomycetales bacterium]
MKRAHVSLLLLLGAVSASLCAVNLSRGQVAPPAVQGLRVCPTAQPAPLPHQSGQRSDEGDRTSPTSRDGLTGDATCPFEQRWAQRPADGIPQVVQTVPCCFAAARPFAGVPAPVLGGIDVGLKSIADGDARWYEAQALVGRAAGGDRGKNDSPCGDVWRVAARDLPSFTFGDGEQDVLFGNRDGVVEIRLRAARVVDDRDESPFALDQAACADEDSTPAAGGLVDESWNVARYGYLHPWCEEDEVDDSAAPAPGTYAEFAENRNGTTLFVEVTRLLVEPPPHLCFLPRPCVAATPARVVEAAPSLLWTPVCGLMALPVPCVLPVSSAMDANACVTVECPAPPNGDAHTNTRGATSELIVAGNDGNAANGRGLADGGDDLVEICADVRHSTGSDVVAWLNRLNDGLGDEAQGENRQGNARIVALPSPRSDTNLANASTEGELAKRKIADVRPRSALPKPWWAELGVVDGDGLVAVARGTASVVALVGEFAAEDWAPPADRWTSRDWPGCDAFCDETYGLLAPASPSLWETLPPSKTLVADAGASPANELLGRTLVALGDAATDVSARMVEIAAAVARNWAVLLDDGAAHSIASPLLARRRPSPPAVGAEERVPSTHDLHVPGRERPWCDASRWPYEDL